MKKPDFDDLRNGLRNSLAAENPKELAMIAGNVTVSTIFEIALNVPVVTVIWKLTQSAASMRDRFYAKKIWDFMTVFWEDDPKERRAFIDHLDKHERGQELFGDNLLLLLERLDHMKKPLVVARIFRDCILGKMDVETAFRLASAVDRAYWYDLVDLAGHHYGKQIADDVASRLNAAGLMDISNFYASGTFERSITTLGKLLVETALLDVH